jgi:hypothetical protein
MDADYFDIVKQGTFFFEIKPCHKIEELSDSFMTRENLELMNPGTNWEWNARIYMGAEIRETLIEWAALIPTNAYGTTRTTPRIKILLHELHPDQLRKFSPDSFTIRGSRIINKEGRRERENKARDLEKKRKEELQALREAAPYERVDGITHADMNHIDVAFDRMLSEEYGMASSRIYHRGEHTSVFTFYKRLCGWDAIAKYHRMYHKKKKYLQDLKYMKRLWDDPTLEP